MRPYTRRTTPVEVRLWRKVDISAGPDQCWPFTGARRNGYGALGAGRSDQGIVYAHRIAYLDRVGPIPEDYQIDHLCRNRLCCNPAHLEAVTQVENLRRQQIAQPLATHCRRGHEFTPATTGRQSRGAGRRCRVCTRETRAAKRAAA